MAQLTLTGDQDAFVAILTSDGDVLWAKNLSDGAAGIEEGSSIATNGSGESDMTGFYQGTMAVAGVPQLTSCVNGRSAFLLKLDSAGNAIWNLGPAYPSDAAFGTSTGDRVDVDQQGNVYLAARFRGATCNFGDSVFVNHSTGTQDMLWAKFAANGTLQWVRSFGGNADDMITAIDTDVKGTSTWPCTAGTMIWCFLNSR